MFFNMELLKFPYMVGISIIVLHYAPGSRKYKKLGHKMFSSITMDSFGCTLNDHAAWGNYIGNTKTSTGLVMQSLLYKRYNKLGINN
jgi:hypothetical protein